MVTASHNPPQDNGYKVYDADGAQIIPPADAQIEAAIRAVPSVRDVDLDDAGVTPVPDSIVDDYVAAVMALGGDVGSLHLVHTALHGVGTEVVRRVFTAAGFRQVESVPQQELPDPDFPTVAFPNPEEPGALDLALELARERGADLVVANDPDADRCAVAVPTDRGEWRLLTGDEVGALLADALLCREVRGTYATTIVSSSLLRAMTQRHGVGYAETLTGFKWISRAAPDLVYGYEEALGYAVAPELVRDKDGISAGLLIASRAAQLAAAGSSLPARLEQLAADYGRHTTGQVSARVADVEEIAAMMRRLRAAPPRSLLGEAVTATDLLPSADVLRLSFATGRVVVRPSGTEPKLKAYLEVVTTGSAAEAAVLLDRLSDEVRQLLGLSPSTPS
jgi:phosphomannomutase